MWTKIFNVIHFIAIAQSYFVLYNEIAGPSFIGAKRKAVIMINKIYAE